MAECERDYVPEKSLEGQASARERGRYGGSSKVVDDAMAAYARDLRAQNVPSPRSPASSTSRPERTKSEHPSVATVYRILAEDDAAESTHGASRSARCRLFHRSLMARRPWVQRD